MAHTALRAPASPEHTQEYCSRKKAQDTQKWLQFPAPFVPLCGYAFSGFALAAAFLPALLTTAACGKELEILAPATFKHHIDRFNSLEDENVTNFVSNAESSSWLQANIPLFECPDREVEEMYYYRWWSFRKHLVKTPGGFVITEFLTPVKHAGAFNTISCAAGFHIAEARWLHDSQYADDDIRFWLRGDGGHPQPHLHKYSSWLAAAIYDRYLVSGDRRSATEWLDDLASDYRVWEQERQLTNGLFWQYDVRDGMEESISGSRTNKNARPTINSYMFANARAIAAIARLAGRRSVEHEFDLKAARLKQLVQSALWDPSAEFFKVQLENGSLSNAREEIGFIPWMFELPDPGFEAAWTQLIDPAGFKAPYGITTAERRHPLFRSHGCCKCEWDGAVWPFATSQTLIALANVLRDYSPHTVSPSDYFDAFLTYVHNQRVRDKPYIGEYHDEVTGQWFDGKDERSRYYNHSVFADLLITGVVGLRPGEGDGVEVYPLVAQGIWDWFCLDGVRYHNHSLTILWDRDGKRYNRGAGLIVLADGKEIARSPVLNRIKGRLP